MQAEAAFTRAIAVYSAVGATMDVAGARSRSVQSCLLLSSPVQSSPVQSSVQSSPPLAMERFAATFGSYARVCA